MSDSITKNKVKLDTLLWQVRELCRKNKLNIWGNQSLANQIYQDLLFIYHVPALCASGKLELDVEYIGNGKLTEVSYKALLSLKEPTLINTAFKRLWKQLQACVLKPLFEGRDFVMFAIEKKDAKKYMTLLLELMNYLASIELEKYDSNAGYTYFKKDLNKAIAKTFGQFYTPSSVTASVVNQVNPKIGEKVLDPSSGSCSFLAEAANYIAKSQSVDMTVAFKDLYGTEVEPNIYAEGVMNMFINFGILPDMNERIREVDALLDMAKNTIVFDKIVANPPFGADASSFLEFYNQTIIEPPKGKAKKGTKKVVLNPEVKCEIPFPKISESAILFFQYIVEKLAPGGKAGVVMSATIFNDSFKDMMKWFLECCSLEKVVINPGGTFKEQGTGIETFSFIFTKGSPTTNVEIVMLGDEDHAVRSLSIDQIKEAGWKLQVKEEEKKVVYTGDYELKKLGDIAKLCRNNSEIEDDNEHGQYMKYFGPKIVGKTTNYQFDGEYILTPGRNSIGLIGYVYGKFCVTHTYVIQVISDNSCRYTYYYLLLDSNQVKNKTKGVIPYINIDDITSLNIILPPLPIQQEIVATLDRIFVDPQDMKDCLAFTDKAMDLMLKDPSGKLLEDVIGGLRLKRSHQAAAASIKAQMAAVMRSLRTRGYNKKAIGDLVEIEGGDYITKKDEALGEYPVYGGGAASYHINRFNREPTCVINKDGMSPSCVQMVSTRFFLNHHGWTLKLRTNEVLEKFLHWQLYFRASDIYSLATGSCQKGLNQKEFVQMLLYIPPLQVQAEVLAILNEMEAELNTLEQMAKKAEQRAKFVLDGYLSPSTNNTPESLEAPQDELVSQPEPVAEPLAQPEPVKPKRVIKLKKTT